MGNANKVEHLFNGDMRCETLLQSIKSLIYERGIGLSVPTIIGILEILKLDFRDEILKRRITKTDGA